MQDYVCGFLFSEDREWVVLIKKSKPEFQRGKLNGVGGKIEPGETPREAMVREFYEETGCGTSEGDWEHTVTLSGKDRTWKVFFFRSFCPNGMIAGVVKDDTPEPVAPYVVSRLWGEDEDYHAPIMSNLRWLIPINQAKDLVYPITIEDDWAPARNDAFDVGKAVAEAPPPEDVWAWSADEKHFASDRFPTREAALADARYHDDAAGVWTGRLKAPSGYESGMADTVLERMSMRAWGLVGEVAEDWLTKVKLAEGKELDDSLAAVIRAWLEKHGHLPTFYGVVDVKFHEAEKTGGWSLAEFMNQEKPKRYESGPDDGYNAMGKPIPIHRKTAACEHCKQMGMTNSEDIWTVVGQVAEYLAKDKPYEAMAAGMRYLDLTGTYRLFAVLLTG